MGEKIMEIGLLDEKIFEKQNPMVKTIFSVGSYMKLNLIKCDSVGSPVGSLDDDIIGPLHPNRHG